MAQRRMFSLTIINSARFLKLPIDAQNLYFHLGIRADDDGVVEAFPVMRLIGSSDDNLKLLHAKQFVRVLNEDLVTFITDWRVHNNIRADRKVDSIYKDLLVEILPEVPLLEPKERADRKKGRPVDGDGTSRGQSMDGIGKDRLDQYRIGEGSSSREEAQQLQLLKTPERVYEENIGMINYHIAERIKMLLEDGITEELLSKYIEIAVERNKKNWSYIEKMALGNLQNNIKTISEYEASQKEWENQKVQVQAYPKRLSKHDALERSFKILEEEGFFDEQ